MAVYALDLEYQRKEHKMTYGLPDSIVVGVGKRIIRSVKVDRRKSPWRNGKPVVSDEAYVEALFALGRAILKLDKYLRGLVKKG